MQTTFLTVQNLLAPCGCACRHCLLCSGGTARGVAYERGAALAWRLHEALPALPMCYSCGDCYDYPEIAQNIALNKSLGFAGAGFLQLNGIRPRGPEEMLSWLQSLKDAGAESADITFYGLRDFHDAFAGRPGDFDLMLCVLRTALALCLKTHVTFPALEENKSELEPLLHLLEQEGCAKFYGCLPDFRGRGMGLEASRLTRESLAALPDCVRGHLNLARYRAEQDWLREGFIPAQNRQLRLALTEQNIAQWESLPPAQIIAELEALDDDYYAALPDLNALAVLYGDPEGTRLYRARDLGWKWRRQYRREHGIDNYDVTREYDSGSLRQE